MKKLGLKTKSLYILILLVVSITARALRLEWTPWGRIGGVQDWGCVEKRHKTVPQSLLHIGV